MAKLPNRAFGAYAARAGRFFVFRRADENIRGVQNERRKMEAVFRGRAHAELPRSNAAFVRHRTGEAIFADDIDVLLPETWLSEQWSAFQTLLQAEDWRLIDAHEHTFEKRGVHCSFAALEELETFAGVPISEIETRAESGAKYRLLSVKQYLAVYKASAKDGYRVNTRGKKDAEKIALLEKLV